MDNISRLTTKIEELANQFGALVSQGALHRAEFLQRAKALALEVEADKSAANIVVSAGNVLEIKGRRKGAICRGVMRAMDRLRWISAGQSRRRELAKQHARWALVVDTLYDEGVDVELLASEIQKRGGIDAVAQAAARDKPRQRSNAASKTIDLAVVPADSQPEEAPDTHLVAVSPPRRSITIKRSKVFGVRSFGARLALSGDLVQRVPRRGASAQVILDATWRWEGETVHLAVNSIVIGTPTLSPPAPANAGLKEAS